MVDLALQEEVLNELARVRAFVDSANADGVSSSFAKSQMRRAHQRQRDDILRASADFLASKEESLLEHFADGVDVEPAAIDPILIPVRSNQDADLFRYASLQWSVPVSSGYGRRSRFVIRDRQNNKLIGIFALGDPVIGLRARDQVIGWNIQQRNNRLYNIYDAYVLGAVEPYRQLIGGKLVALCTLSNEVRDFLVSKYAGRITEIRAEQKDPTPALITTTSSLGRSSTYNRVTFEGRKMFRSVGYTEGFGHFQISDELFKKLKLHVEACIASGEVDEKRAQSNRYGQGPNWKFRVIRNALELLGIEETDDLLKHQLRREVFLAPAAQNWDSFLRGETDSLDAFNLPLEDLASYYRERWAVGRANRRPEFRHWKRESLRIAPHLEGVSSQLNLLSATRNPPARVSLPPFELRVGVDQFVGTVRFPKRPPESATIYVSHLVGPDVDVTIGDATFHDGTRALFGISVNRGPTMLDSLIQKNPLEVERTGIYSNLVGLDVRTLHQNESGRVTKRRATPQSLSESFKFDVAAAFDKYLGATVDTRSELVEDVGATRKQLMALVSLGDRIGPAVIWSVTRAIGLLLENSAVLELRSDWLVHGTAPDLEVRSAEGLNRSQSEFGSAS